jgi:hypothetical protein
MLFVVNFLNIIYNKAIYLQCDLSGVTLHSGENVAVPSVLVREET